MRDEHMTPAHNTRNGVVNLPKLGAGGSASNNMHGVKLGEMDCKCWG